MAAFGSFALLIALALAAYNLLAGALALRLIATGQPAPHLARAAGRYGAPGRNRRVFGRHRGRFRAGLVGLYQRFFHHLHPGALQPRPARRLQVFRSLVRPGGLAAVVGVAAGSLRLCPAAHAQARCEALRLRRSDSGRNSGLLSGRAELCRAALRPLQRRHPRRRQRPESRFCSTRRW